MRPEGNLGRMPRRASSWGNGRAALGQATRHPRAGGPARAGRRATSRPDLAALGGRDGVAPRIARAAGARPRRARGGPRVGRPQVGREVEVHELGGEAGRRPERAEQAPRAGPHAGLLLELARRGEGAVLDLAGRLVDVERAGRDLQQDAARPGGATGGRAGRCSSASSARIATAPGWPQTSRVAIDPSARPMRSTRNVR